MRRSMVILLILLMIILLVTFIFRDRIFGEGCTTEITDDTGKTLAGSIASLERIGLGGLEQSILIRGYDTSNPVLLWLHGGPGSSQMPVAHYVDCDLERSFTMVHWDQRGSGRSNPKDFDEQLMDYESFIEDGHELTLYLKRRFSTDKIYLLGHSWGSQLGLELAGRYPEDYHSYIGVSQVISNELSEELGREWLEGVIEKTKDRETLEALGPPPFEEHEDFISYIRLIEAYGGSYDLPFSKLLSIALRAPEYSFADTLAWFRGANRGSGKMWDEEQYSGFDAREKYPEIAIPVYFFAGDRDHNTPLEAVRSYYEQLEAPAGKHLVVFPGAAHTPFLSQRERFTKELERVAAQTYVP